MMKMPLHKYRPFPSVALDDRRWPDLSYLQPVAAVTQDLVDCVMGIYEVNGVVRADESSSVGHARLDP